MSSSLDRWFVKQSGLCLIHFFWIFGLLLQCGVTKSSGKLIYIYNYKCCHLQLTSGPILKLKFLIFSGGVSFKFTLLFVKLNNLFAEYEMKLLELTPFEQYIKISGVVFYVYSWERIIRLFFPFKVNPPSPLPFPANYIIMSNGKALENFSEGLLQRV